MSGPWTVAIAGKDGMPAPVEIEREPRPDGHAGAKGEERMRIVNRTFSKDDLGLVIGDVDDFRLTWDDAKNVRVGDHLLLRRVDERSGGAGFRPEPLDRLHDVCWLFGKYLADLLGPRQIFVHPLQHLGIVGERLYTFVPGAMLDLRAVAGELAHVARGEDDIRRRGGRRQNQGNQRIGIECDRGDEPLDFLRRATDFNGRCPSNRHWVLGANHRADEQQQDERDAGSFHFKMECRWLRRGHH